MATRSRTDCAAGQTFLTGYSRSLQPSCHQLQGCHQWQCQFPALTFCINCCPPQCQTDQERTEVFQIFIQFFFYFWIFHSSFFKSNRFASLRFISLRFELIFVTCHVGVGLFLVFLLFQLPLRQQKSYVIFHFEMPVA